MDVSGRFRARAKVVKLAAVSPSPWRRRRMFGGGSSVWRPVEGEGWVIVIVWFWGKSEAEGVRDGMLGLWCLLVREVRPARRGCEMCWRSCRSGAGGLSV